MHTNNIYTDFNQNQSKKKLHTFHAIAECQPIPFWDEWQELLDDAVCSTWPLELCNKSKLIETDYYKHWKMSVISMCAFLSQHKQKKNTVHIYHRVLVEKTTNNILSNCTLFHLLVDLIFTYVIDKNMLLWSSLKRDSTAKTKYLKIIEEKQRTNGNGI